MKLFFFKDTFKKISGIVIIITGSFLLFVALYALVTGYDKGKREDIYLGFVLTGFSAAIIIPGLRLFRSGVRLSRLEENLKEVAALVSTYRRIALKEIADKFKISEFEAEKLLNRAVSLGLIKGNMDRTTGEFFVPDSLKEIKKISFCPNCGTSLSRVIHTGETGKCPSCGSLFN